MSEITGKLSNRVMNMKFMKFSKSSTDETESEVVSTAKKFSDSSEWTLPKHKGTDDDQVQKSSVRKVIRVRRTPIVLSNVGVATIKEDVNIIRGRRMVGEPPQEHVKRSSETAEISSEKEDDGYEPCLDQLFKESKNSQSNKNKKNKHKKQKKRN
ncbi:hypothetical protein Kpol_1028p53 [Vanderwaltozyma polyspora DSM 70294]|uniref:Uncharacterized protein n=1 Tax=Vanderwaltozyma polyspora (strain ATCC 22028 / DSM 70294 / BCRC 21397 / CBS 2163 / NBRC 10782 / NRRL Y-8283 / UCD 57-17) TaxID=436907 RepID=A7TG21_VANPO|nr:uncharacterized protein Kpol_1028p53 [Vanderwaltozyma polyspora DSM 70294]EDO18778.1 hypothetical protein Kpol_1028p53 [Vanderwaltozyma polyspora DSM 70294]